MRSFYHCSTAKYRRRKAAVLVLAGSVCAEAAVIAFLIAFFGHSASDSTGDIALMRNMTAAALMFVAAGLAVCFAASALCDKKAARHSRYTYLDVQLKAAVISIYSGEMTVLGRNAVFREMYLVPFSSFAGAEPSANGRKLVIRGKIRRYGMESDFLGYHIRNGDIEFDRMWLNVGSFEELQEIRIPAYFGSPAKISGVFAEAAKRFNELPKPKKHQFREADFIRRRPVRRVLPDNPDFSRTWK